MEIGQKLRQARQEMGLSQRQLCQELITRNMLSQIENGSARPSMEVLCTLAARLGKPVSFFLEEQVVVSANQEVMADARQAFDQKNWGKALEILESYRRPDGVFDGERALMGALCCLHMAQVALEEGKRPYALQLLQRCGEFGAETAYYGAALERQRKLLLARVQKDAEVPGVDQELLLMAQRALDDGDGHRAAALLAAVEDQRGGDWNLLRGRACFVLGQYREAAEFLHRAEGVYPEETGKALEICYRELEDYKMAYYYATKKGL